MNNIIYEDNHLLIVNKEPGISICEDSFKEKDLLNVMKEYLKEKYNKPGQVYLGLVHRLDKPVGGLVVFAKTSKSASRLSESIRKKEFEKTYFAVAEGITPNQGIFKDKLLKNKKTNISEVNEKGKESVLRFETIQSINNMSLVKIKLETGRSHQIRVQFASRGYPLVFDQKYNFNTKKGDIALFASGLSFVHPTTKEIMKFNLKLPNKYPWNIFKENE